MNELRVSKKNLVIGSLFFIINTNSYFLNDGQKMVLVLLSKMANVAKLTDCVLPKLVKMFSVAILPKLIAEQALLTIGNAGFAYLFNREQGGEQQENPPEEREDEEEENRTD